MPATPGTKASEELVAAPLGDFIRDLGIAVAVANRKMNEDAAKPENATVPLVYTINEAEIEVSVAISIASQTDTSVGGSLGLSAFSVNAAYKSTFSYKEDASSRIKISLSAKPRDVTPAPRG